EDPFARRVEPEPRDAVDLGKTLAPAGTRRTLDRERMAEKFVRIEVARAGEAMHGLAAFLLHRRERNERLARRKAGFLGELAQGRCQQLLARIDQPLRDGPDACVLLGPERPAGMTEQDF